MNRTKTLLFLMLILVLGAWFRFSGLNWDSGNLLHPDERFLTMVTSAINLPASLSEYLNTDASPANPHNQNFGLFVYGTLPVHVLKIVSLIFRLTSLQQLTLAGRAISGFLDIGVVLMIFLFTRITIKNSSIAFLAAFLYAASALPIQLSHFFSVDSFMVFFGFASILFASLSRRHPLFICLSGICFALSLSSKVYALLFLPIIGLTFLLTLVDSLNQKRLLVLAFKSLFFVIPALVVFRLAYPYFFASGDLISTINPKWLANWKELNSWLVPSTWFPPSVQWFNLKKGLFPFINILFAGLGLPLGLVTTLATFLNFRSIKFQKFLIIPLVGSLWLFIYQSLQLSQPIRYFYPLYPFFAISAAFLLYQLLHNKPIWLKGLATVILLIWPLSVVSIYNRPHTRVVASDWIRTFLPAGSTLSCEHWDDCLPLGYSPDYTILEYPLYGPDSQLKWQDMRTKLANTDYLILSSNRLYGSIVGSGQYPETTQFYSDLFSGKLGFTLHSQFSSRPNLPLPFIHTCINLPKVYSQAAAPLQDCPLPGVSFVDDYLDESWTVYDHPKVLIFKNTARVL